MADPTKTVPDEEDIIDPTVPVAVAGQDGGDDDDIDPLAPLDDDDITGPLSDHEKGLLSDEELAALTDDEEGDEGDGDAQVETAAAAVATETPAVATQPAAPQAEAAKVAPASDAISEEAVTAAETALEDLRTKRTAINTRYDDGEMTAAERDAEQRAIDDQIGTHAAVIARAEDSYKQQVATFKDEAVAYFAEVPFLSEAGHIEAFDRIVRQVSASPLAEGLTFRQMLETAHRRYEAEAALYGVALPQPAPKVGAATAKIEPAPASAPAPAVKPKPALAAKPEAPVTLRNVPAAAITGTSEGKYSSMEEQFNAIPEADVRGRERFLARMSAEEREFFSSADF